MDRAISEVAHHEPIYQCVDQLLCNNLQLSQVMTEPITTKKRQKAPPDLTRPTWPQVDRQFIIQVTCDEIVAILKDNQFPSDII